MHLAGKGYGRYYSPLAMDLTDEIHHVPVDGLHDWPVAKTRHHPALYDDAHKLEHHCPSMPDCLVRLIDFRPQFGHENNRDYVHSILAVDLTDENGEEYEESTRRRSGDPYTCVARARRHHLWHA